jgi:hypothetical protein
VERRERPADWHPSQVMVHWMGTGVRQGGNGSSRSLVVANNMARIPYRGTLYSMNCHDELHQFIRGRHRSHLGGRGRDEAI